MISKRNKIITAWLIGFSILLFGLQSLHSIFSTESDNARAELLARRNALNQYAAKALKQNLHNRLKFAQVNIEHIANDPLASDRGLLLINQGEQILPRPVQHSSEAEQNPETLYQWIKEVDPLDLVIEKAGPWEERLHLLSNFKLTIENEDIGSEETRWAFREIRENRSRDSISVEKDIPYMLAIVDYFLENSVPSKSLLQGVLRGGSIIERENRKYGLQRTLLANRNLFTLQGFNFLRDKIVELSEKLEVNYVDFLQQSVSTTKIINTAQVNSAAINYQGNWYVEPIGGDELVGISVDFVYVIEQVKNEMILLGLIQSGDSITISTNHQEFTELPNVKLNVISTLWDKNLNKIVNLYWLKTSLLAACALFIITIVVLVSIITYRKNRYLQLKYDFLATVSHELRTPLAALRLMSETMQRKGIRPEKVVHYSKRIVAVIDELNLLVENILSFNRLSKDAHKTKRSKFHIKDAIEEVGYEIQRYSEKPLTVDTSQLDDIEITGDMELVKILIRNLLTNSYKYNDTDHIEVNLQGKLTEDNQSYTIDYHDNGIGINETEWQHVFTEFVRLLRRDKSVSGTGLGLAICQRIMLLHKGKISISSSTEKGTHFNLEFPLS